MITRAVKAILIAALVIRLVLLWSLWQSPDRLETPDSRDYIELSDSLARDGRFERDGQSEIFRTPGYPMFLAVGAPLGESWWRAVIVAQVLLDVLLVYLTWMLTYMLCGQRAAIWAAAFQAVAVVSLAASFRLLSDSLFATMLTMTILLLVHHFRTTQWWSLLAGAVLAAAACYVRPVGLVFCLLVAVVLLGRRRLAMAGAFAGVVILAMAPWVARNVVTADYVGFCSFATDSMYKYTVPAVIAQAEQADTEHVRSQLLADEGLYRACLTDVERTPGRLARYRQRVVLRTIVRYPVASAAGHLRRSPAFWLPGVTNLLELVGATTGGRGTLDVLHERGLLRAADHYLGGNTWAMALCVPAVIVLAVKYGLVLICVFGRVRLSMGPGQWLVLLTIIAFALVGGHAATPRFRVPVEPLLSLAAGVGAALLAGRITRRAAGRGN